MLTLIGKPYQSIATFTGFPPLSYFSFQPIAPDDVLDVLEASEHEAVTSGDLGSSALTSSLLAASLALGQMLRQEDREWFFKADESPYVAAFVQLTEQIQRFSDPSGNSETARLRSDILFLKHNSSILRQ